MFVIDGDFVFWVVWCDGELFRCFGDYFYDKFVVYLYVVVVNNIVCFFEDFFCVCVVEFDFDVFKDGYCVFVDCLNVVFI